MSRCKPALHLLTYYAAAADNVAGPLNWTCRCRSGFDTSRTTYLFISLICSQFRRPTVAISRRLGGLTFRSSVSCSYRPVRSRRHFSTLSKGDFMSLTHRCGNSTRALVGARGIGHARGLDVRRSARRQQSPTAAGVDRPPTEPRDASPAARAADPQPGRIGHGPAIRARRSRRQHPAFRRAGARHRSRAVRRLRRESQTRHRPHAARVAAGAPRTRESNRSSTKRASTSPRRRRAPSRCCGASSKRRARRLAVPTIPASRAATPWCSRRNTCSRPVAPW